MKIFVGYGFNDRDKWVEELVFPIIKAFDDQVVEGGKLQGDQQITEAVERKIKESDGLIAFATRREALQSPGRWITHEWVSNELTTAKTSGIPFVEVREEGVDRQSGGMTSGYQYIVYDEKKRDKCLVELVEVIGKWHQKRNVSLRLLPEERTKEIFPLHRKDGFVCSYTLLVDGDTSEKKPVKIIPKDGGLSIELKDIPKQALVQVHAVYGKDSWVSSFENADSVGIQLQREA